MLLRGLKTKLEDTRGPWADELPSVLWSYCTTTRETPFSLCYGAQAVIPVKVGLPSFQIECFDLVSNSQWLRECLDLLPEVHDVAHLRTVAYPQRIARYYNKWVKACPLEVGDLVLRSVEAMGKTAHRNKLSPNWEGLFLVLKILQHGAYKLRIQDGNWSLGPGIPPTSRITTSQGGSESSQQNGPQNLRGYKRQECDDLLGRRKHPQSMTVDRLGLCARKRRRPSKTECRDGVEHGTA
ncbi:hypothetical protein Nepgr_021128 [Nepenthes gracilis]|uniref:Uncharacterized protein n=1 Tax=Nepenthes gracilis TaxID=150966 RepID=A0AAD3XVP2_NEPGR|nr:hypothetical protein Nepgr_021128 [Nepenthes gracilis]